MKKEEKILYLECYSGISGDMTVGALLDLGTDKELLEKTLSSLPVGGYHLHFGRTKKCGIDAFDFDLHLEEGMEEGHDSVPEDGNHSRESVPEGEEHTHDHTHGKEEHAHHHENGQEHYHEHHHEHGHGHGDEMHTHACPSRNGIHSEHTHFHRNLNDVTGIIEGMDASEKVKGLAKKIFLIVAEAEAKAHGVSIEEVHFHEVGAIDSIVDIIGTAVCLDSLGIDKVFVSPLYEGRGFARCQHGVIPVPVPAVANIVSAHRLEMKLTEQNGEMVTPTGAAIAAALQCGEKFPEKYCIEKIGIGAGKKDFAHANILRAMLIKPADEKTGEEKDEKNVGESSPKQEQSGTVVKLETNLDDCTGEALGFVMEELLEAGALDVWFSPVFMKKNRPAYILNVLCEPAHRERMEKIIFTHTTTIGIRRCLMERTVLKREIRQIHTPYGEALAKVCMQNGREVIYPEYESVKKICREKNLPFGQVFERIKQDKI